MDPASRFSQLCELEPRLCEVEAEARAAEDDGTRSFYCSNFVWLPLYMRLRDLVGTYRKAAPGEKSDGVLFDSASFEASFLHLSPMIPPCRNCGCTVFEPVREAQLREMSPSR
ncbi:MAG TPA: hypothetical protein ENJ09_12105 [Planctomycetes bacterium]|nr:hypothetical protein [Planctomycetota bacterium]